MTATAPCLLTCPCRRQRGETHLMTFTGPVRTMAMTEPAPGTDVAKAYLHAGRLPGQRVKRWTVRRWDYVRCRVCASTVPYAFFGLTEWPDHRPARRRPPKQRKRRSR